METELYFIAFGGGIITGAAFMFGIVKIIYGARLRALKVETERLKNLFSSKSNILLASLEQKAEPQKAKAGKFNHIPQVQPIPVERKYKPYGWQES